MSNFLPLILSRQFSEQISFSAMQRLSGEKVSAAAEISSSAMQSGENVSISSAEANFLCQPNVLEFSEQSAELTVSRSSVFSGDLKSFTEFQKLKKISLPFAGSWDETRVVQFQVERNFPGFCRARVDAAG